MIFSENRYPLFRIMLLARQNAAGRRWVQPGFSAPHVVIGGGLFSFSECPARRIR